MYLVLIDDIQGINMTLHSIFQFPSMLQFSLKIAAIGISYKDYKVRELNEKVRIMIT